MRKKVSILLLIFLLSLSIEGQVSASDIIFDFGSAAFVDNGSDVSVATLDSTHVIITTNNGIRVGTRSGSTIAFGTQTALITYVSSVAAIDATHAVVAYMTSDGDVYAITASMSGTNISLGSPAFLSADGMPNFKAVSITVLDTTHVAVAYHANYPSPDAYAVIGEISEDSISWGSPTWISKAFYVDLTTLDSSHIALSYDDFNGGGQKIVIGEVSGTDVSFGAPASAGYPCVDSSVEALDATHVLFAYCDVNDGNSIKLLVGVVSGTDVSLGTQFPVGAEGEYFSLAKLDSTHAAFSMQNISLGLIPVAYRLTIDGSDISIGTSVTIADLNPDITAVTALNSTTIVYALTSSNAYTFVGTERTRPDPVTDLTADVEGSDIVLNWTNPADPDFASVSIRRGTSEFPATIDDGTVIADGLTTSTYTDENLSDGEYLYSVFVVDTNDYPSDPTTIGSAIDSAASSADVCSMRTYWALDTFASSTAPDSSGNGFDAVDLPGDGIPSLSTDIPTNGPLTNSHSFHFTAADVDYLRATLPVTNDFTLCAWVKTTTAGSGDDHWESRAILHAEAGGVANDFGLGMNASNKLIFGNGDETNDYSVAGSTAINTGEWVHTCVTRQKSSGQIRLYVNGNLDGAGIGSTTTLSDSAYIYVGGANDGGTHWNGSIDDIRIYDSVLNAAEISSIANRSASCFIPSSSSSSSSSSERPQSTGGRRGGGGRTGGPSTRTTASPTNATPTKTTTHPAAVAKPSSPVSSLTVSPASPLEPASTPTSSHTPSATVTKEVVHLLTTVQIRLEERVQQQIVRNPTVAPMLQKMLTRMKARITKLMGRSSLR